MATHYYRRLDKSREAIRQTSFKHYHGSLTKVEKLPRKGWQEITAKICHKVELSLHCQKDLPESRSKSRYISSSAHCRKAEAIRRDKRDRYSLAEPKKR